MNTIHSKDHGTGAYKMNKSSLSYFDDKMHILNNGYDGFALGYYEKTGIFIPIQKNFFVKLEKYYFNFRSNQDSFFVRL